MFRLKLKEIISDSDSYNFSPYSLPDGFLAYHHYIDTIGEVKSVYSELLALGDGILGKLQNKIDHTQIEKDFQDFKNIYVSKLDSLESRLSKGGGGREKRAWYPAIAHALECART